MFGLILYRITSWFLIRKNNLISETEVKATNKKMMRSVRWINIKIITRNNFDIKPAILKLFFCSYWINGLLLALTAVASILYTPAILYNFFGCQISDMPELNWPWLGILIINILYILFVIRMISDYYKLSLRGTYRNNYLKLLFLDIFTFNIFSIIGSLIFLKNKEKMFKINNDFQINYNKLNSQAVKNYSKIIFKIELFMLLVTLIVFLIALITGYFVQNNSIKLVCLFFTIWTIAILYAWSGYRIIAIVIAQKMLKNLLNNNGYYLLTTIRFLIFSFGSYYSALLINLLKFDENSQEFILENW